MTPIAAADLAARLADQFAHDMADREPVLEVNAIPIMVMRYTEPGAGPDSSNEVTIEYHPDTRMILRMALRCEDVYLTDALAQHRTAFMVPVLRYLPMSLRFSQGLPSMEPSEVPDMGNNSTTLTLTLWTTQIPMILHWASIYSPDNPHAGPSVIEHVLTKMSLDISRHVTSILDIDNRLMVSDDVAEEVVGYAVNKALGGSDKFQKIIRPIVRPDTADVTLTVAGEDIIVTLDNHALLCKQLLHRPMRMALEIPPIRNIKL